MDFIKVIFYILQRIYNLETYRGVRIYGFKDLKPSATSRSRGKLTTRKNHLHSTGFYIWRYIVRFDVVERFRYMQLVKFAGTSLVFLANEVQKI